jgi:hypothetical protein
MEQPSKQESQQLLAKLKSKGGAANKVTIHALIMFRETQANLRHVLTAVLRIQHGALYRMAYISASTAALYIGILVFTSHS